MDLTVSKRMSILAKAALAFSGIPMRSIGTASSAAAENVKDLWR